MSERLPRTSMHLNPGKKHRLNRRHLQYFQGPTLFDRLARAVCEAECLPRKELYEAWETARRVRRRLRGGPVVDLAAGHGLLAWVLLILDDSSPHALCVDVRKPPSAERLERVLLAYWPRLQGRVCYQQIPLDSAEIPEDGLLVCLHGCGSLTDQVLVRAIDQRLRVAVLPCCHHREQNDTGGLEGWLPVGLAVDSTRVARLREAGFQVWTQQLPEAITPQNRLLMARPR